MPFVPQWNGDVKVYQCNDNLRYSEGGEGLEENFIASKLTFGISISDIHNKVVKDDNKLKWENIRLKEPPYCYVRREIRGHKESPISFYRVLEDVKGTSQNKLFFCIIPFYTRNGFITFNIDIKIDKKKKSYHFSKMLSYDNLPPLFFRESLQEEEIKSYSRYFGIDEHILKTIKKSYIGEDFQKKYIPMDLMSYQGNYYWSLYERDPKIPTSKEENIKEINGKTDIYGEYLKDINKNESLWFHGKIDDVIKVLSTFVAHPENRKRITTVDIYMLQLKLIRKDVGCRKLLALKNKPKWAHLHNSVSVLT